MSKSKKTDPALWRGKTTVGLMAALLRDHIGQPPEAQDRRQLAGTAAQFASRDDRRLTKQRARARKAREATGSGSADEDVLSAVRRLCPEQLGEKNVLKAWTTLRAHNVRLSRPRLRRLLNGEVGDQRNEPKKGNAGDVTRLLRRDATELTQAQARAKNARATKLAGGGDELEGQVALLLAENEKRTPDEVFDLLRKRGTETSRAMVRRAMTIVLDEKNRSVT